MASRIFQQIFDRKLTQFVGLFSEDSSVIFKNEKEKLIHPGEYGKYREETCKELLRLVLDRTVKISDGFVISSYDHITTQCDIIVYNANTTPLVADDIARMFPAEEVRMIGEVKSTLNRQEFIDALRKMAHNKRIILDDRSGTYVSPEGRTSKTFNTITSFLICNKLCFDYDSLKNEDIYEGIDRKYWHNAILSVEDVSIDYIFEYSNYSQVNREKLQGQGFNLDYVASWGYPVSIFDTETINNRSNYAHLKEDDRYAHIRKFFVTLSSCCKDTWVYTHDPILYLGMDAPNFYLA